MQNLSKSTQCLNVFLNFGTSGTPELDEGTAGNVGTSGTPELDEGTAGNPRLDELAESGGAGTPELDELCEIEPAFAKDAMRALAGLALLMGSCSAWR